MFGCISLECEPLAVRNWCLLFFNIYFSFFIWLCRVLVAAHGTFNLLIVAYGI